MTRPRLRHFSVFFLIAALASTALAGNKHAASGTVVLGGGFTDTDGTDLLLQRMIREAGAKPNVVIIPTADEHIEPAIKAGTSVNPIDYENDVRPDFMSLGAGRVRALHTRNKFLADKPDFSDPLRFANLVWIPGGDPQLLFSVYPHTRVERELKAVLERGGVVAGDAAGAILLGQMWLAADPDHPRNPASAPEAALGLLPVVVMPRANRYTPAVLETGVKAQIGARPEMLGLLIDENTAVIIRDDQIVGIVGKGRVGVVESATSVRWLQPRERYDLKKRQVIAPVTTDSAKAQ
jgi:cyanophycinase